MIIPCLIGAAITLQVIWLIQLYKKYKEMGKDD